MWYKAVCSNAKAFVIKSVREAIISISFNKKKKKKKKKANGCIICTKDKQCFIKLFCYTYCIDLCVLDGSSYYFIRLQVTATGDKRPSGRLEAAERPRCVGEPGRRWDSSSRKKR